MRTQTKISRRAAFTGLLHKRYMPPWARWDPSHTGKGDVIWHPHFSVQRWWEKKHRAQGWTQERNRPRTEKHSISTAKLTWRPVRRPRWCSRKHHQTWWPEFSPWDPRGGRREPDCCTLAPRNAQPPGTQSNWLMNKCESKTVGRIR